MDRLLILQVAQCWICPSCQQVPHNGLLGWPRGQGSCHVEGCVPMGLGTIKRGLIRIQIQLAWTLNIILHTLLHSHRTPFDIPETTSTTTFPHLSLPPTHSLQPMSTSTQSLSRSHILSQPMGLPTSLSALSAVALTICTFWPRPPPSC